MSSLAWIVLISEFYNIIHDPIGKLKPNPLQEPKNPAKMPAPSAIEKQREKIYAAMKAAGYPVDQWHDEIRAELEANPTAKARPFTKITPPQYGKIKKLRPGFEEFTRHPAHGRPVPRCQAAKKRTGGMVQCKKFAANGTHLCRTHGGAAGSGKNSAEGRENQRLAVTIHGDDTLAKRAARSEAAKARKGLRRLERGLDMQSTVPRVGD